MLQRRTPLKPGKGFRRPERVKAAKVLTPPRSRATATMRPVAGPIRAMPKGEPAKPGKGAPTLAEKEWMEEVVAYGCIACHLDGHEPRPTAIHHLLRGGVRMGHLHSIGLCDPGHHQGGQPIGLISRHPWKPRFEERYGSEQQLLVLTYERITLRRRAAGLPALLRPAPAAPPR